MRNSILGSGEISSRIYFIRGHYVMLDADLAVLYQVKTKSMNQAVKRNLDRFPSDFMFQLSEQEFEILRSQFVTLRSGEWGKHSKYLPFVFTEQGVSMLSGVLKSKTAIQVNIAIMRTFVKIREITFMNNELNKKIDRLEEKYADHDQKLSAVFEAIRKLINAHSPPMQKRIKRLGK